METDFIKKHLMFKIGQKEPNSGYSISYFFQ